jgi:hypothetical protein
MLVVFTNPTANREKHNNKNQLVFSFLEILKQLIHDSVFFSFDQQFQIITTGQEML